MRWQQSRRDTDWQLYHYCHSQPAGEGTPYNSIYGEVPAQNWYHFQALGIWMGREITSWSKPGKSYRREYWLRPHRLKCYLLVFAHTQVLTAASVKPFDFLLVNYLRVLTIYFLLWFSLFPNWPFLIVSLHINFTLVATVRTRKTIHNDF